MGHCPTGSFVLALCFLATIHLSSFAQSSPAKNSYTLKENPGINRTVKNRKSATLAAQERLTAISMLNTLAEESDRYRDQTLRARTQARVADSLWDVDESLARSLFLRAWKVAEDVDSGSTQNVEQARKVAFNTRGSGLTVLTPLPNLRSEVLKLASRRDPVLAGEFLARIDDDQESSKNDDPKDMETFDPTEPRLAIAKRLEVARQLLETGDMKQAKQLALPALDYVTSNGIIFLCGLRQKETQSADELYASLLMRAEADPRADATTVSLLSSYIFTPNLLVTATQQGRVTNQFSDGVPMREFSQSLRANFFAVAAKILLRRTSPSDLDQTAAGRAGTYFTIARLLPLFEQYAGDYVPGLNAQLALLAPGAPETFRNGEEGMLKLGLGSATSGSEDVKDLLDQLSNLIGTADRDVMYVKAIRAGAINGDGRIREFAERIDNPSLKDRARSFASLALVRSAIKNKDADGVLKTIDDGYLTQLQRVWALVEVSRLVRKSDPDRALQIVNDAAVETSRIPLGEPDRIYALVCVALPLFDLDRGHWSDLIPDVVKSANAMPGFGGEGGKLYALLRTRDVMASISVQEPSFDLMRVFELLTKEDLQTAVSMADNLTGEAPRSIAKLAIARSVLNRQKAIASTTRK